MMTTKQIKNHIKENQPWTAEKEWNLIVEMNGATKWGDNYYVTYSYPIVSDKINEAIKETENKNYQESESFKRLMKLKQEML